MTEQLFMRINLCIDQGCGSGLRLEEQIMIARSLSLEEAAKILTRFSELAKEVSQTVAPPLPNRS